jgi:uncharacterized protein
MKLEEKSGQPEPVTSMALMVSESCNLRCSYCYGGETKGSGGKMETSVAEKAVDWMIQQSKNVKTLRLLYFGGEPLMNFPLIRTISAYAREKARVKDKAVKLEITTNATLLNSGIIDFFVENHIIPLISFDGPKKIHDRQRPFSSGAGSYDHTVPLIRELLEKIPNAPVRVTWLNGTDPAQVIRGLRDIGFRRIFILPATLPVNDEINSRRGATVPNFTPLIRMAGKDARRLLRHIKNRETDKIRFVAMATILMTLVGILLNPDKKKNLCPAGTGLVGVSSAGEIYPCHRFLGIPGFRMGSVLEHGIVRYPNSLRGVDEIQACSACDARYTCRGGCFHDNLITTGDFYTPSEESCRRKKAIAFFAERIVWQLDGKDIEYLYHEQLLEKKHCILDFN